MSDIWNNMVAILKAPVAGNLDTRHLFLLVGLVIIMVIAWIMIIRGVETVEAEV